MKKAVVNACLLFLMIITLVIGINRRYNKIEYIDKNNYLAPIIEGDNYLSIDVFSIDNEKKIIYDVPIGTPFNELLDSISTNGDKAIYNQTGELLEDDNTLYTSDVLKISFSGEEVYEYKISVLGDVLGEGEITKNGINEVAKYIIDKNGLDDISFLAADYNHDGEIKMNYVMLMLFIISPNNNATTKFTANFHIPNGYISSVNYSAINCETIEGSDSCQVEAPILTVEEGYEAVGFSENENATEADFTSGDMITISSNKDYYAIVKKSIEAEIETLDNAALTEAILISISCDAYNGLDSCDIVFPEPVLKEGYEVVGFSQDKDDIETDLIAGSTINITEGVKYYLITRKKVTITFDKNTTFDNNTVAVGEDGYDYLKTNIEADSLSFYETSCYSYNGNGCYIDDMPIIYSPGNEIHGFATNATSNSSAYVLERKHYDNMTYYARVYNLNSGNDFTLGYSEQIGNVVVEFEEGMDAGMVMGYIEYINQLYGDIPELFQMKGKLRMFKKATYETAYARLGSSWINTAGCTTSIYTGSNVDIKLKSENSVEEYRKGTIVHELSHALDHYYGTRTRNYSSGKIRHKEDVINLYNSYLNQSPRPLRNYSYTSIAEFWADSSRWYYSEEFNGFDNASTMTGVPEYQPANDEIKDMVRKYMCIARNNFDEEAICS